MWGSVLGIIRYCSSMMPACILSSSWASAWCCRVRYDWWFGRWVTVGGVCRHMKFMPFSRSIM